MSVILEMKDITKVYPNGFVANKNVNLELHKGEIHALLGENGAGKTTLMKILFGFENPEHGEILLKGESVKISDPLDAIGKGIGMVHQHFMLVPSLSVAENIVLGSEPTKGGVFDKKRAIIETKEISDKFKLKVEPSALIKDISVGLRQKVEILKALYRGAEILVLDEPTAVLTPQETEELFVELVELKNQGHTIVFISHKLDEIKAICDRFTVLRRGETVGTGIVKDTSKQMMSELMIGRKVDLSVDKTIPTRGEVVMEASHLNYTDPFGKQLLTNINMKVHKGEVVGIAGIEGNGQSEFSQLISGELTGFDGSITVNGKPVDGLTMREIRNNGLANIPEDRMVEGCSPTSSVKENIIIDRYYKPEFSKGIFLDDKKINEHVDQMIREFNVKTNNRDEAVAMLSGGNIQKVIAARELSANSDFIIANQPTRGIDIGSTVFLRNYLLILARNENKGVLLISADINELLEVADSLAVFRNGKQVAFIEDTTKITDVEVGEYMLGLKTMELGSENV